MMNLIDFFIPTENPIQYILNEIKLVLNGTVTDSSIVETYNCVVDYTSHVIEIVNGVEQLVSFYFLIKI